jgi:hypothetical protein
VTESALGAYLLRRKVGGVSALHRAIDALSGGWGRRVNHVDDIFVEAINIAHCGLRPGRRRRHGITTYANGQPAERVTSYYKRELVYHEGEFFAAVFEAASRWAPLPRELVAAYSVDALQEEGVRALLWDAVMRRLPIDRERYLCPKRDCRGCDRWV